MTALRTLAQIKAAAKAAGNCWFSVDTVRYWSTRLLPGTYPINNGAFFITSEAGQRGTRAYTVRLATINETGRFDISTVGEFMGYKTPLAARRAAQAAQNVRNA
jgi:hypothetical protein